MNTKRAAALLYRRSEESRQASVRKDQAQEVRDFMRGTSQRRSKRRRKPGLAHRIAAAQLNYQHYKELANRIHRRNAAKNAVLMRELRTWLVELGYDLAESPDKSDVRLRRNGYIEIRFGGRGWPGGEDYGMFLVRDDGRFVDFHLPDSVIFWAPERSLVHA